MILNLDKKNRNKGFTLIELLVVIAIIAILALIVFLALNPVEMARKSRDSDRLSDLATLRRAIDLALADDETLPAGPFTKNTGAGGAILDADDAANNLVGMDISKYLAVIPQDPTYEAGSTDTIQTTNGVCPDGTAMVQKQNMVYTFTTDGDKYVLTSRLESTDNCKIPSEDGGDDNDLHEVGTDLAL